MASGSEPDPETTSGQTRVFATTHWSVVLAARDASDTIAREALETLCRAYWYPLYAFVRRRGHGPEDAQDLTQSFFARLLEKNYVEQADRRRGKFRTFLLAALNHFLADEWDRANRLKRGGGKSFLSLDAITAEQRYQLEPIEPLDAAKLFERRWAMTLLERGLARLEEEFRVRGQSELLEAARPFLLGERGDVPCVAAAARLGMSEAALRMAVSRMRARCRQLLREEILQTVGGPDEAEEEYRALLSALRH